jgi:hypothetical protein
VLSWEVSITLESSCCVSALERALVRAQPAIFNSDPGAQFTSLAFPERWLERRMLSSMDGRGQACAILYAALDKTFFFDLLATVWCSPMTETAWNV